MDFQSLITHNPFLTYLMSGALGGIIGGLLLLLIQTTLKQGVAYQYKKKLKDFNHQYDEKLASFNEQIAIQAEYRKLDFDRKIHDFSLYSSKRHELYPALFKQIHQLEHILRVADDTSFIHLDNVTSKDQILPLIKKIARLSNFKPLEMAIDEEIISGIQEFDPNEHPDWNIFLGILKDLLINNIWMEIFKDIRLLDVFVSDNVLYFSEDVISKVTDISDDLKTISIGRHKISNQERESIRRKMQRNINELRLMIKKELTVGDYSPLEKEL
ncbi:hypothetical protein [Priestia aryabhattai]|uniref:hypothetical protein n=1 Tax=Priestia aryabhattai TaxID=412384 RepID=UPI003D2B1DD0